MKFVFSIACLASLACVIFSYCLNEDDCKPNECCVAESSYDLVKRGWCVRLGRRGSRCNKPESKIDYYGGKYVHECPCQEGLVCEMKGNRNYTHFLDDTKLRCRRPVTTVDPEEMTTELSPEPEVVTEEETSPPEVAEGPGGEPPRDDDCENWEYPC